MGAQGEEIKDKRPVIKAVRGAQHSTGGIVSNPVITAWRGGVPACGVSALYVIITSGRPALRLKLIYY